MTTTLRGFLGIIVFSLIAWMLSQNRKAVSLKVVLGGLGLQLVIAAMVFNLPWIDSVFKLCTKFVDLLQKSMLTGAQFVFGFLAGGDMPFTATSNKTFILAFQALPLVIFISALTTLLFHWRILPAIIKLFSNIFKKTLNLSGVLSMGSAANIFFGNESAPLIIKPHLKDMTRSELFSFMTVGMATVSGTIMVVYATILQGVISDAIGHILAASIISVPAALTISRIIIPETKTVKVEVLKQHRIATSSMDAITKGTLDGVQVFINVVAMLIVLISLVAFANQLLSFLPKIYSTPITLQGIFGIVLAPIVWLMGIPYDQAMTAGTLMGTKTVLNELIAYIDLANLPAGSLDKKSTLMMIYALCGFANFGSVGIMIGSLGTLVPSRREEVVELGLKTIVSGTLATLTTGAMVGIFG